MTREPAIDPLLTLLSERTGLDPELAALLLLGVQLLAIIIVSFLIAWAFRRFVLNRAEALAAATANDVDDRIVWFLRRFYNAIVVFLMALATMHVLGIEITPLLAGAGIAGIAVAYAGKDLLGNMIAGVVLLVDQPIRIGDRIQIDRIGSDWGSWGDVVDIGLRTTTIRNTDGVLVTYPNARLADSILKNFSPANEGPVRFRLRVVVPLDSDLKACLTALEDVARAHPEVLPTPAPSALVRALYDDEGGHSHHGALLELRVHIGEIRRRTPIRSDLLLGIQQTFRERGLEFGVMELRIPQR